MKERLLRRGSHNKPILSIRARLIVVALLALSSVWFLQPQVYEGGFMNAVLTVFPALYIGLFLANLSLVRHAHHGLGWVVTVLAVTWGYDTGAYFAGSFLGRRPFMHHVSPRKTVEGIGMQEYAFY